MYYMDSELMDVVADSTYHVNESQCSPTKVAAVREVFCNTNYGAHKGGLDIVHASMHAHRGPAFGYPPQD